MGTLALVAGLYVRPRTIVLNRGEIAPLVGVALFDRGSGILGERRKV
ncbi:MAG: hypothetical protein MK210_15215 [Dehalococcoidia bacterium]|nr:hypothetical protein [Dehalococcoidia bacterium]